VKLHSSSCRSLLPCLLLLAGCGTTAVDDGPDDAWDDHVPDGGSCEARFLDEGPALMFHRETRRFAIDVVGPDGPMRDLGLDLALEGDPADSSLETLTVTTGPDGRAEAVVQAGASDARFALRAVVTRSGAAARLDVRVTDSGPVPARLDVTYDGARAVERYRVRFLEEGTACPAVPAPPDTPDDTEFELDPADPAFDLPTDRLGRPLRVAVTGLGAGFDLLHGCGESTVFLPPGPLAIPVRLEDLPFPPPGTHSLRVSVPLAAMGPSPVEAVFAPFARLIDGETGLGAFVVPGMIGSLRAAGDADAAMVLERLREADGLEARVEAGLAPHGAGLAALLGAWRAAAVALAVRGDVLGEVAVGEWIGGTATTVDRWSALRNEVHEAPLRAAEGAPVEAEAPVRFESARVVLDEHDLPLSLGRVAASVLTAVEADATPWEERLAARLAAAFPCEEIALLLAASTELASVCPAACLEPACESWRSGLVAEAAAPLAAADSESTFLRLSGECGFLDPATRRLRPGGGCEGVLRGVWRGTAEHPTEASFAILPGRAP
jgi:hypothetical protein